MAKWGRSTPQTQPAPQTTTTDSPLLPGESLLWTGQPMQGWVFGSAEKILFPFSLLWGGFAIFWNAAVWSTDAPLFFRLFGLPFLVVGLHMIGGRFILDRRNRARTHYAVTDQRVMISEGNGANIRSFPIDGLPKFEMVEDGGGRGSILFGAEARRAKMEASMRGWPGAQNVTEFYRIDDVRQVYELIRKTAEAHRKKS